MALGHSRGVTIAIGTDIAGTDPDQPNSWGQNGAEPDYLVKLGMTLLEALEAGTATAPFIPGPQAPDSGLLGEDFDADVITLVGDPLVGDPLRFAPVRSSGFRMLCRERALNWYRRWGAQASVIREPVCSGIHGPLALLGCPNRLAKLLRVNRQGACHVLPVSRSVFICTGPGAEPG